ncbi:hypothetical protein Arub01_15840 [Actinomadura rubrobrunea]|uniref:Lipoprotein n=1 Tax=Actinomadura rubrobrunea TaxID=115335 RepID=A0A9W6PRU6_9ACTN|nr:hypothetical protein [Actinomadura rubrobrunea]GLW63340.1 hypothetical protein Arub01_15840 [Actinomadura rubrobrunea]
MNVRGRVVLMGSAVAACTTLAGCNLFSGGGVPGGTVPGGPVSGAPAAAPARPTTGGWPWRGTPPIEPRGAAAPTGLRAMDDYQLGRILVDNRGRAVYRYDRDSPNPSVSRCVGPCAQTWPPVLWKPNLSITGVDPTRVGRIRRPDGTVQVTVGGWPLYHYSEDSSPGDQNGQGVNNLWFVARPNGTKAQVPGGSGAGAVPGG